MEPSVLEARATEGELTSADPAKATQEENGEKSSSRESDPDDAALGEDDKNITRTRKRESFESTLKLHRTFNNHSLKQRIFIDEPDDRPGAFPAIQDRDGENIDPQPPPQSDKITIGEGWNEEPKMIINQVISPRYDQDQDRDGENIDPQPPPQSDTISIGGGWSEEIKKVNNKIKTTPTYTLAPTKRRRRSKLPPGRCMKQKSIILLLSNSTKICFSVGGNKGGPAHAVFPPNETPSAETDAVHPTVVSLSDVPARDSPDAKMLHKVTTAEDKSRPTPCETFRLIREAIERGKVNCYAVGRFFPSHQSQEWTQRRPKSYLKKHTVETAIQLCENSDATAKENCSGYDSTTGNSSIFSQDLTLWRNEATLSAVVRFVEGCWGFPSARVSPVDTRVPQQISLERSRLCSAYYITIWACRPYPYLVNRIKSAYATRYPMRPTSYGSEP